MSKIGIERLGEFVHAALERQHSSHWRPASTAPHNQDLELRVSEDGATVTLPFPCRHTNGGEWVNVDLGVRLQIQPVEWRVWRRSKSPRPYQTSIFGSERSALHRQQQWGGCHEATTSKRDGSST
jgi:hypothetical protein